MQRRPTVSRPPGWTGLAAKISAGFCLFASTGGRREASYYGGMIESQRQSLDCGVRIVACGLKTVQTSPISRRRRYPTTPLFYCSTIPARPGGAWPAGRGTRDLVQTNPICPSLPCQTKPIWEEFQVSSFKFEVGERRVEPSESSCVGPCTSDFRRTAGGTSCTNKPNFRMRQNEVNCCCGKRLQVFGGACWSNKTKPIRLPEDVGRGRPTHEEPRGNRAKQSQFQEESQARVRTSDSTLET